MIITLLRTLLEAAPYIVLGFFVAGLIHQFVPQNFLSKHLGASGHRPLFKAVGIGALLPLCSCGTIPLAVGLYRCGAAVGTILTFATSSPVLSPVVIALSLKLLGFKLTLTLIASALLGSFLIGLVGNAMLSKKQNTDSQARRTFKPAMTNQPRNPLWRILKWSFWELGAETSIDILIGLCAASIILTILPMEWIATWLGKQQLSTLVYVIIIGIPVYACSVPSVPIVQSLLLLGATPGAAVAYMIAGPATNLGELNAIRNHMGLHSALYYPAALLCIALAAGLIADNWVFPDYQYSAQYMENGNMVVRQCCVPLIFGDDIAGNVTLETVPLWHWPFGAFLAIILLLGVIKRLREFLTNPCPQCLWRGYNTDDACQQKCHVRRKHELFMKLFHISS